MNGNIIIDIQKNSFAASLLASIYSYYPIGADFQSRNSYKGYQELIEIADRYKDPTATNEVNLNFEKLNRSIKNEIGVFLHIGNGIPGIFPSLSTRIMLNESVMDDIKIVTSLKLRISLLHKSWTLFYEDVIITKRYGRPFMSTLISTQNTIIDETGERFIKVNEITGNCYPDHIYVEPRFLLTQKIGNGIPYGIDENVEYYGLYPIYDYLFHKEFSNFHIPRIGQAHSLVVLS